MFQFHPFDKTKKMNWNMWFPGVTNVSHFKTDNTFCLMLNTKTGEMKMKPLCDVTIFEWNQVAGNDFVVAVANESECF